MIPFFSVCFFLATSFAKHNFLFLPDLKKNWKNTRRCPSVNLKMLTLTDSIHGVPTRPSAERRWLHQVPSELKEQNGENRNGKLVYGKYWWYETMRQCGAEFLGDLIFVFIGSLVTGSIDFGQNIIIKTAFGQGLTIFFLIASIGHISGHFNPAITFGFVLVRELHPIQGLLMVFAQLLGGFVGALLVRVVISDAMYDQSFNGITSIPNPEQIGVGEAIACELFLTYFLVQTVLCCFVGSYGNNLLGALAVGMVIVADIFAGGTISGASMNPARSFGPSLAASIYNSLNSDGTKTITDPWTYQYVYWVGPLAGSILASIIYWLLLADDQKRWFLSKQSPKPL